MPNSGESRKENAMQTGTAGSGWRVGLGQAPGPGISFAHPRVQHAATAQGFNFIALLLQADVRPFLELLPRRSDL